MIIIKENILMKAIRIDKAIESNEYNLKILSDMYEGLKSNTERLKAERDKGVAIIDDSYTKIQLSFKSYYTEMKG